MADILRAVIDVGFAFAIIRITTPIAFAALGALITDLAGTINIALEGIMLQAAFWGGFVSAITQNVWLGLAAGVLSGLLTAAILGYFNLRLKADLIIAGIALNILAAGSTVFFLYVLAGDRGISVSLRSLILPSITLPFIAEIPGIGAIVSGHHILTYIAVLAVFAVHYLLYKTPFGLRLRAVGENPAAAQSVGISAARIKFIAILLSGLLASLGGLFISMGYVSWFSRDMIAGRGFIGLIAAAVAGRSAYRALGGAMIFGTAAALAFIFPIWGIASELTNMFPYVITLIALAIWGRKRIRRGKRERVNSNRRVPDS